LHSFLFTTKDPRISACSYLSSARENYIVAKVEEAKVEEAVVEVKAGEALEVAVADARLP